MTTAAALTALAYATWAAIYAIGQLLQDVVMPDIWAPPTTGSRLTDAQREALRQAFGELGQVEPMPQPEPEPNPSPGRKLVPPVIPEGGEISVYREVSAKDGKPALNPGAFTPDPDGLSTWEAPYLPGRQPFVVRFDLFEIGVEVIGSNDLQVAVGFIKRLPQCFGWQSYLFGTGHWSLLCPGQNTEQAKLTFSTYAKTYRTDVVGPNPAWKHIGP